MYLFKNQESFEELLNEVVEVKNITLPILVKDYFVSLVLGQISKETEGVVFKGGTALSKGFKIIDRFSEDIDLGYNIGSYELPSQGQRKRFNKSIKETIEATGIAIRNTDSFRSRRQHNKLLVQMPETAKASFLKEDLQVEIYLFNISYPAVELEISNYIYDFLVENGTPEVADEFVELKPFKMQVQSLERTFIDKLFAISDQYIGNRAKRNSRHIFDLYEIAQSGLIDISSQEFANLFCEVKEQLSDDLEWNPSAAPGFDILGNIKDLLENDFFEEDYEYIQPELAIENNLAYSVVRDSLLELIAKINIKE
ncbi:MAG: nucleotidyl transferase AbiEii/AbiGii toxin family protein [Lactobacillales bacterium]|jgi:predicted nucleotidyltransferase component of viral defense system|nr:nucleotidyl transferase AbiEii/AbiGii toxin family protein [Lactobacillales bacterium]